MVLENLPRVFGDNNLAGRVAGSFLTRTAVGLNNLGQPGWLHVSGFD
jgi:hypothetical protein